MLRNIRYLWLTEERLELIVDDNGVKRLAKWTHLKQLYRLESEIFDKLSGLNEMSIVAKPAEKQRVSTCHVSEEIL